MVLGADCSAGCCWPMAGKNELLGVSADGGTVLMSKDSKALVKYYSKGVARVNTPHLIDELLLLVLFAIDPSSFFFAYRTAESKLKALEQPTTPEGLRQLVSGQGLPAGIKAPALILVWRASGLRLIFSGAVHQLRTDLGESTETSDGLLRWPHADKRERKAARDLVAARDDAQLLASFDERLPEAAGVSFCLSLLLLPLRLRYLTAL